MIPRVSNNTVKIKGRVRVTPGTGTVTKGTGTVWQKSTLGIPVLKPNCKATTPPLSTPLPAIDSPKILNEIFSSESTASGATTSP